MIKTIHTLEEVIDFAWELSRNNLYASFPRRNSIEDLKKELENAINRDNHNVIAYYDLDKLCGVCAYFWTDDKYAQTVVFLIRKDYDRIADEFISYMRNDLPGYELFIGVPIDNKIANEYFIKRNIEQIESSIVTVLYDLELYGDKGHNQVEKITISNFEEYAKFHDEHAIPLEMYYDSGNLKKDIDVFRIFVFRQGKEIYGSVFTKANQNIAEIVGLFVDDEHKNKGIDSVLIKETLMELYNEFGSLKEILYFIDEDSPDELNIALEAGFEIKEKYRCFKCIL